MVSNFTKIILFNDFYTLPEILVGGKKINPHDLMLFINGLALFHKTRYLEGLQDVVAQNHSNTFSMILEATLRQNMCIKPMMGSLNIASASFIIERVLRTIRFDKELDAATIASFIDFIAYDLNGNQQEDFKLLEQPFLKINGVVFYNTLSLILGNPSIIVENFLLKQIPDEDKQSYQQKVATQLEINIMKLFREAGFHAKQGVKLKNEQGKDVSDIDILVWRDNQVLVIQTKKTYTRRSVREIESYQKTLEHAGKQVDVCVGYIKQNMESFLFENSMYNVFPNKIEVYGLVVSSTFEGNFKLYGKGKYPKISLAELSVLIEDAKNLLVDCYEKAFEIRYGNAELGKRCYYEAFNMSNDVEIQGTYIAYQEECFTFFKKMFLWEGKRKNIKDLVTAIQNDWLWSDLITLKKIDFPNKDASKAEKDAFILYGHARAFEAKRDFDNVLVVMKRAITLVPNDPDYLCMYATAFAETGNKEKSIELYTYLIEQHPEYFGGYWNRGVTLLEENQKQKAFYDFQKAFELKPYDEGALYYYLLLGLELKFLKDKSDEDITRLLESISDAQIKMRIGVNLIAQHFGALEPMSIEWKLYIASFCSGNSHYFPNAKDAANNAFQLLNEVLKERPLHPKALNIKGWLLMAQEYNQEAIETLELALDRIEDNTMNARTWAYLGLAYHNDKQNFEKAEYAYIQALQRDKKCYIASFNLGTLYKREGKHLWDKAIQYLSNATDPLSECKQDAFHNLAWIHEQKGEYELAIYHYKELLKLRNCADEALMNKILSIQSKLKK